MGIYGGSNKNLFPLPSNASDRPDIAKQLSTNKYNVQVNDKTQVAQVYRQGSLVAGGFLGQTGDVSIGTYNLQTKKFTPDPNAKAFAAANPGDKTYSEELKFFGSANGKKLITTQSAATVQKGVVDGGGTIQQAQSAALKVTGTNAATEDAKTTAALAEDLVKEQGGTRNNFSLILKYPENLQAEYQDVIKFNMVKYSPKNFASSGGSSFGFSSRIQAGNKGRDIIGTVTLPIPGGISDGNLVDWGSQSMNALQIEAAKIALAGINNGGKEGADAANDGLSALQNNLGDAKKGLSVYFAQAATGVTGLLARTQGAVTNPNMELLFNGPQLRPFNFTFRLSPRSKKEAESVRSIIRFFKQGMSPIRTQSNLFLKAPHTFQIQYLHKNKEHKFINKIKECALQSFTVNYTPEANYATFTDGAMVSYEIQMQFTELEPIFNDDYGNADNQPDTEIGF